MKRIGERKDENDAMKKEKHKIEKKNETSEKEEEK